MEKLPLFFLMNLVLPPSSSAHRKTEGYEQTCGEEYVFRMGFGVFGWLF